MLRWKLLGLACGAAFALAACERQTASQDVPSPPASREPLRHGASINDPRPLESVTGTLLFERGCWVVTSGPNRIAIFFPRETKLVDGKHLQLGRRRLSEGQTYKFVGDLSETAVDKSTTCNGLPSSIAAGDVWLPQPEQQWNDSFTPEPAE